MQILSTRIKSPLDLMLGHQREYHDDQSRFKAWLKARQIGGSFTSAAEPVADCYAAESAKAKETWITLSRGERQSLEWLDKAKQWTEAFKVSIADIIEERDGGSEALLKSATIVWPHGARIIALPANPDTARGYSGHVNLDEFDFHEDPDGIWRAVYPIVSNPLKGTLKLRVLSSANRKGGKFHQIITENKRFSVHCTDIYQAAKYLAPGREEEFIAELREGMADPEGWAQEFENKFIDTAAVLFSYELLAMAESPEASEFIGAEYWQQPSQFPVDLGIDFGRKKDLTVCWAAESVSDIQITKEVLALQGMSTPKQVEILSPRIAKARRVCFDYTGPGIGMGDYLVEQFGEYNPEHDKFGKIELCTFTNAFKNEIFPKLKMSFERRQQRIPVSRTIREDLHSINRIVTTNGNVTYRAPHSDDGHADRATALALCCRAGSQQAIIPAFSFFTPGGSRRDRISNRSSRA